MGWRASPPRNPGGRQNVVRVQCSGESSHPSRRRAPTRRIAVHTDCAASCALWQQHVDVVQAPVTLHACSEADEGVLGVYTPSGSPKRNNCVAGLGMHPGHKRLHPREGKPKWPGRTQGRHTARRRSGLHPMVLEADMPRLIRQVLVTLPGAS